MDHEEAQQGINVIGNGDFQNVIFGYIIMAHMVLLCHSNVLALTQWKNVGIPADEAGRISQYIER